MLGEPVAPAGKNVVAPAQEGLSEDNVVLAAQERLSKENVVSLAEERLPVEMPILRASVKDTKAQDEPDLSGMTQTVTDIQENLNVIHNVDLKFTVHEDSGRIMITVQDQSTGEVIREIPPSAILNLAARLDEMVGLLFDQTG
jgi:uncharacterized FlaG/YvyC family protein